MWVKLFDEFQQIKFEIDEVCYVRWEEEENIDRLWRHPFILRVCESRSELSLFSSLCDKLKMNRDQLFLKMTEKSWAAGV